jgi:hypothetical protein
LNEIFTFINRKQVEKKFEGEAYDLNENYFPPIFPSNEYIMDENEKQILLLEENMYKLKLKINKELIPSPFINLNENESYKSLEIIETELINTGKI